MDSSMGLSFLLKLGFHLCIKKNEAKKPEVACSQSKRKHKGKSNFQIKIPWNEYIDQRETQERYIYVLRSYNEQKLVS